MSKHFGALLKSRRPIIGTIVTLSDPQVGEILSGCGSDWLFIDGEHAPLGAADIQRMLAAVQPQCACVVRIPDNQEAYVKKAAEQGCPAIAITDHGVMHGAIDLYKACKKYNIRNEMI